jgi:hypothetical protein
LVLFRLTRIPKQICLGGAAHATSHTFTAWFVVACNEISLLYREYFCPSVIQFSAPIAMIDASHYLDCDGNFALRIIGFSNAKTNGNAQRARQAVDGHHDDTCNVGGVEGFVA